MFVGAPQINTYTQGHHLTQAVSSQGRPAPFPSPLLFSACELGHRWLGQLERWGVLTELSSAESAHPDTATNKGAMLNTEGTPQVRLLKQAPFLC